MDLMMLAKIVRKIQNNQYKENGVISIDSDGVYLRDARVFGIECQERVIRVNNRILNSTAKPSITKKFWFFIDGVEFYSYNDV